MGRVGRLRDRERVVAVADPIHGNAVGSARCQPAAEKAIITWPIAAMAGIRRSCLLAVLNVGMPLHQRGLEDLAWS